MRTNRASCIVIKPENIMLSDQHAFVMDFGIAKAASIATQIDSTTSGVATAVGIAIGTPAYKSAERAPQLHTEGRQPAHRHWCS
ncbi:MAG TPA: hypothetical protein VK617_07390 [Gemmatimonadaceae bacterium]|nr:hypothetical protein [Gemmatimonadaceae bacterium]